MEHEMKADNKALHADRPKLSSTERTQLLSSLQEKIRACRKCEAQFGWQPNPIVFGAADAKILQISQAPGRLVHESGKPFSDLSGKKLRQQWYEITDEQFYNPHNFYITSMGHCYPGKSEKSGDNKPPKCCYECWTKPEIEVMDSVKLIVVIGQEAASRLFPKQKLKDLVFENQSLNGIDCIVLPHPSPLNSRWMKQNPAFEQERLPQIRAMVHAALQDDGKESQEKTLRAKPGISLHSDQEHPA